MVTARKKWATSFPQIPPMERKRHPSEPAVYRYLKEQAARVDVLRSPMITIWVDEGDGQGWQTFERIDLRQVAR